MNGTARRLRGLQGVLFLRNPRGTYGKHICSKRDRWIFYDPMSDYVRATNPYKTKGRVCWYIKITLTDPATNRERHLKKTTGVTIKSKDSLSKAHEARLQILAEYQSNHDPLAPMRLHEFSEEYIREREAENAASATLIGIKAAFRRFAKVVGENRILQHISTKDVRKLLFHGHQSPYVAQSDYKYLRSAFERAVRDEKMGVNPFNQIDKKVLRKRTKPRPRGILTEEQVALIYEQMPKDTYVKSTFANYFLLLFGTAFRRSEACFLELPNIDMESRIIRVRNSKDYKLKTDASSDDIPMTDHAFLALQDQLKRKAAQPINPIRKSPFIFCSSRGEHYNPNSLTKRVVIAIRKACKELGIDSEGVDLHSLRHSLIQHLIDSGVQPVIVSKFARHANLSTTLSAYHKTKDTKTKFEEVLQIMSAMPKPS